MKKKGGGLGQRRCVLQNAHPLEEKLPTVIGWHPITIQKSVHRALHVTPFFDILRTPWKMNFIRWKSYRQTKLDEQGHLSVMNSNNFLTDKNR